MFKVERMQETMREDVMAMVEEFYHSDLFQIYFFKHHTASAHLAGIIDRSIGKTYDPSVLCQHIAVRTGRGNCRYKNSGIRRDSDESGLRETVKLL